MNWIKDYKHFCEVNKLKESDIKSLEYFVITEQTNFEKQFNLFKDYGRLR